MVVSKEVDWVSKFCKADPNSSDDICHRMGEVWKYGRLLKRLNKRNLERYCKQAERIWLELLGLK